MFENPVYAARLLVMTPARPVILLLYGTQGETALEVAKDSRDKMADYPPPIKV